MLDRLTLNKRYVVRSILAPEGKTRANIAPRDDSVSSKQDVSPPAEARKE